MRAPEILSTRIAPRSLLIAFGLGVLSSGACLCLDATNLSTSQAVIAVLMFCLPLITLGALAVCRSVSHRNTIAQRVSRAFQRVGWQYQPSGNNAFELAFNGDHGRIDCVARVRPDVGQVLIYSVVRRCTPKERRTAMVQFLAQANCGLPVGNFEIDLADGEVRFKTSLDVGSELNLLTPGVVRRLVDLNVYVMDKYVPGIMGVITGQDPTQALARIESGPHSFVQPKARKIYLN